MKCLLASPEPIALSVQIFALSSFLYSHLWDILSSYVSDKSHLVMSYYLRLHGHIPLSMEFSRQEYWSGLPFPLQGIFLSQGLNAGLLRWRQTLYHLSHQGSLYDIS